MQKPLPCPTPPACPKAHRNSDFREIPLVDQALPSAAAAYQAAKYLAPQKIPTGFEVFANQTEQATAPDSENSDNGPESPPPPLYSSVQISTKKRINDTLPLGTIPEEIFDSAASAPLRQITNDNSTTLNENPTEALKRNLCINIIKELETFAAKVKEYHVENNSAALETMIDLYIRGIFAVLFNPVAHRFNRDEYLRIHTALRDCLGDSEKWLNPVISIPVAIDKVKEILLH